MPKTAARQFWLFKTEPRAYSIDDLAREKGKATFWDGVRNYQARNLLRDSVRMGDGVLIYHSSCDPMAIVGSAVVVKAGYPDHTAWDPASQHPDPRSTRENPIWYMVDIQLVRVFNRPLERAMLASLPELRNMLLLRRGSRLSIQPVTPAEWRAIHRLAGQQA